MTKQKSYSNFLYKKLFRHFKNELLRASELIIIGYGGGDEGINKMIFDHYHYDSKPSYIFDPGYYDNDALKVFGAKLHAIVYTKSIEDFEMSAIV